MTLSDVCRLDYSWIFLAVGAGVGVGAPSLCGAISTYLSVYYMGGRYMLRYSTYVIYLWTGIQPPFTHSIR